MHDRTSTVRRTAGVLGILGGAFVFIGTYWASWFSLTGQTTVRVNFGSFTLYGLHSSFSAGDWYSHASQVMTAGGVVLAVSGLVGWFATGGKWWGIGCAVGMAAGAGVVIYASLATGLPNWRAVEPLYFSRGPGEWICLVGALLGIAGCILTSIAVQQTKEPLVGAVDVHATTGHAV